MAQTPDANPVPVAAKHVFPTTPTRKPDGQKWRIGYFKSGDYVDYPKTLHFIAQGLQQLGWVSLPAIPDGLSGKQLWQLLAEHAHSDTIEFVADAWWHSGNFDADQRPEVRKIILERLKKRKDIDLVIAMGTWAGQDMASIGAPDLPWSLCPAIRSAHTS